MSLPVNSMSIHIIGDSNVFEFLFYFNFVYVIGNKLYLHNNFLSFLTSDNLSFLSSLFIIG